MRYIRANRHPISRTSHARRPWAHRLALAVLVLVTMVTLPALASEPTGDWWTEDDKARVTLERCGDDYCATIVELGDPLDEAGQPRRDEENPDPALRDKPLVGREILRIPNEADRKGKWRKGRIYDPENGKTYKCLMWLDDDELVIKGYIGVTALGRKTRWRRNPAS